MSRSSIAGRSFPGTRSESSDLSTQGYHMFHPRADRPNQFWRRYRALRFAAMAAVRAYNDASAGILDSTMAYQAKSMQVLARASLPYALALVAIGTAYGLAHVFLYFHLPQPFAVLALCAIAITFWCCGTGPGILATLFAAAVRTYFFSPEVSPIYLLAYDLIFVLFAMLMMQATKARRELESRVAKRTKDLTRTNEDLKREIADRVSAEEKLRQSEAYLEEAQRLAHIGSWVWRIDGREAVYLSDEWYRIWGFDTEDGVPTQDRRVGRVHPEDRHRWVNTIEQAIAGKSEYEHEFRILLPTGAVRYIYAIGHPVLNASGDLVEFVGTSVDITERKHAEEEHERLRQAQAELARITRVTTMGELMASLAHEVNQPITAALTNAKTCLRWLTHENVDLQEVRAAALRIVKDTNRAAEIISRIRLLFKKGTLERESLDINEVIRDMIILLMNQADRYSVSIRADFGADLPQIVGDGVQLQQVLMNLMLNGIDAVKDAKGEREVRIKSDQQNHELLISVTDTGIGLPAEASKIFDAFFTTKADGTGMGLSISRSIIESHGGRLWAANNSSQGATFFFTLPIAEEAHE